MDNSLVMRICKYVNTLSKEVVGIKYGMTRIDRFKYCWE